jgi:hypothetical protein
MSDYSSLKATINANIKANNNHEITGAITNSVLNAMVDSLGAGYQFKGVATPTNPGSAQTPDYKCFYIATTPGTYTYLGGLVVADGEVAILKWDSAWTKEVTGIATAESVRQLGQEAVDATMKLILDGIYVTGNLIPQIVLNRAINTDGTIANNLDRSLLKIPVYDYSTLVVLSGFYLLRYAFCSENPDLHSSQASGFISATTSSVQPTSIPQNAKWIIYDISTASIADSVIATYTNTALNEKIQNPILKNHTYEIRYRGTAQLCWDDTAKKLYWTDGVSLDGDGSMIHLNIRNKLVIMGVGGVLERAFATTGNAQLLLPLPSGEVSPVYTLNDIVVADGTTYDETAYVKIAHITFGNAISSFICQKEVKDNVVAGLKIGLDSAKMDIEYNSLDIASLIPNHDYAQNLLINKSIDTTGILENYVGRYAVFFKMPKKETAPTIVSDVAPAVYQWYSGKPDYITGSNSLGRTTSNTPPANAEYCGLTFVSGQPTTILITGNEETKELKNAIGILGSNLNNSVGENNFANGLRTNLKILGYGNSFMRNSVAYLSAVAKGCGVNLVVGNLYTGGTELQNHLAALRNNTAEYEWHKYVDGNETQSQGNQTPMRGLLEERWDAIIVHQYIPWQYPFEPTLNQFLKLIIERIGYTPKIYINATWAGSLDDNETYYGYETEEEMWEAMLTYVKGACADSGVQEFSIIPTGTAIQNARTLSWADDYNRFVNASPDLHHLNPAGGFIAACTLYQKIVAPLNGVACSNTTFRITSDTSMPPQSDVQPGILVTDDNYAALCKCAVDAVNSPYVVTQQ